MSADIIEQGVVALAESIARGEITSEAVTELALARLATRGRRFNGVVLLQADEARAAAREADKSRARGEKLGALHGVPMAHKDLFYRAGRVAACGSIRVSAPSALSSGGTAIVSPSPPFMVSSASNFPRS